MLASNATAMALGDLDDDGRQDAAVVNSSDQLNVLFSTGDGTFVVGPVNPVESLGSAARSIAVGDFSGDGHPDVVVGNISKKTLNVFFNLGNGQLQPASFNPLDVACQPVALTIADLNGDNLPDVVVACFNPNEIHVLKSGGGQNAFTSFTLKYLPAGASGMAPNPRAIAVGELNGDAQPDIALGTEADLRILNSPTEGSTTFTVSIPLPVRAGALAIGDVNGNKVPDVSVLIDGQEIRGFESAGVGAYGQFVSYPNIGSAARPVNLGLGLGDFLKDGHSSMVVTLPNPSEVKLVVSRGETGVVSMPAIADYQFATGLSVCDGCFAVGDVTGDGLPDVALRNANTVSVLVNKAFF